MSSARLRYELRLHEHQLRLQPPHIQQNQQTQQTTPQSQLQGEVASHQSNDTSCEQSVAQEKVLKQKPPKPPNGSSSNESAEHVTSNTTSSVINCTNYLHTDTYKVENRNDESLSTTSGSASATSPLSHGSGRVPLHYRNNFGKDHGYRPPPSATSPTSTPTRMGEWSNQQSLRKKKEQLLQRQNQLLSLPELHLTQRDDDHDTRRHENLDNDDVRNHDISDIHYEAPNNDKRTLFKMDHGADATSGRRIISGVRISDDDIPFDEVKGNRKEDQVTTTAQESRKQFQPLSHAAATSTTTARHDSVPLSSSPSKHILWRNGRPTVPMSTMVTSSSPPSRLMFEQGNLTPKNQSMIIANSYADPSPQFSTTGSRQKVLSSSPGWTNVDSESASVSQSESNNMDDPNSRRSTLTPQVRNKVSAVYTNKGVPLFPNRTTNDQKSSVIQSSSLQKNHNNASSGMMSASESSCQFDVTKRTTTTFSHSRDSPMSKAETTTTSSELSTYSNRFSVRNNSRVDESDTNHLGGNGSSVSTASKKNYIAQNSSAGLGVVGNKGSVINNEEDNQYKHRVASPTTRLWTSTQQKQQLQQQQQQQQNTSNEPHQDHQQDQNYEMQAVSKDLKLKNMNVFNENFPNQQQQNQPQQEDNPNQQLNEHKSNEEQHILKKHHAHRKPRRRAVGNYNVPLALQQALYTNAGRLRTSPMNNDRNINRDSKGSDASLTSDTESLPPKIQQTWERTRETMDFAQTAKPDENSRIGSNKAHNGFTNTTEGERSPHNERETSFCMTDDYIHEDEENYINFIDNVVHLYQMPSFQISMPLPHPGVLTWNRSHQPPSEQNEEKQQQDFDPLKISVIGGSQTFTLATGDEASALTGDFGDETEVMRQYSSDVIHSGIDFKQHLERGRLNLKEITPLKSYTSLSPTFSRPSDEEHLISKCKKQTATTPTTMSSSTVTTDENKSECSNTMIGAGVSRYLQELNKGKTMQQNRLMNNEIKQKHESLFGNSTAGMSSHLGDSSLIGASRHLDVPNSGSMKSDEDSLFDFIDSTTTASTDHEASEAPFQGFSGVAATAQRFGSTVTQTRQRQHQQFDFVPTFINSNAQFAMETGSPSNLFTSDHNLSPNNQYKSLLQDTTTDEDTVDSSIENPYGELNDPSTSLQKRSQAAWKRKARLASQQHGSVSFHKPSSCGGTLGEQTIPPSHGWVHGGVLHHPNPHFDYQTDGEASSPTVSTAILTRSSLHMSASSDVGLNPNALRLSEQVKPHENEWKRDSLHLCNPGISSNRFRTCEANPSVSTFSLYTKSDESSRRRVQFLDQCGQHGVAYESRSVPMDEDDYGSWESTESTQNSGPDYPLPLKGHQSHRQQISHTPMFSPKSSSSTSTDVGGHITDNRPGSPLTVSKAAVLSGRSPTTSEPSDARAEEDNLLGDVWYFVGHLTAALGLDTGNKSTPAAGNPATKVVACPSPTTSNISLSQTIGGQEFSPMSSPGSNISGNLPMTNTTPINYSSSSKNSVLDDNLQLQSTRSPSSSAWNLLDLASDVFLGSNSPDKEYPRTIIPPDVVTVNKSGSMMDDDISLFEMSIQAAISLHRINGYEFDLTTKVDLSQDIQLIVIELNLPLGLVFQENEKGCCVTKVLTTGSAVSTGLIEVGDQLASVDGISALYMNVDQIAHLVRHRPYKDATVELRFVRFVGRMTPSKKHPGIEEEEGYELMTRSPHHPMTVVEDPPPMTVVEELSPIQSPAQHVLSDKNEYRDDDNFMDKNWLKLPPPSSASQPQRRGRDYKDDDSATTLTTKSCLSILPKRLQLIRRTNTVQQCSLDNDGIMATELPSKSTSSEMVTARSNTSPIRNNSKKVSKAFASFRKGRTGDDRTDTGKRRTTNDRLSIVTSNYFSSNTKSRNNSLNGEPDSYCEDIQEDTFTSNTSGVGPKLSSTAKYSKTSAKKSFSFFGKRKGES